MNDEGPKTLIEAVRYFSDKKVMFNIEQCKALLGLLAEMGRVVA